MRNNFELRKSNPYMKVVLLPNSENSPRAKKLKIISAKPKIQLNVCNNAKHARIIKRQVQTTKVISKTQLNKTKSTPSRSEKCHRRSNSESLSER